MKSRKRRLPKTPGQFLALSVFACGLLLLVCLWNYFRYDMPLPDTLMLKPVPDKGLVSKANKHFVYVPLAGLVAFGGVFGACVTYWNRQKKRRLVDHEDNGL